MLNNTKNYKNESCIDFEEIDTLLKKYVRVKTYLSMKPIFGEILESTESTITVIPEYIESFEDINYDKKEASALQMFHHLLEKLWHSTDNPVYRILL